MLRLLLTISAMLITSSVSIAQVPRWTPFKGYTAETMPPERYGSSYGFTVEKGTTIVADRFRYPLTDPPLFEGDRIISIKGQDVTDEASILSVLDAAKKMPVTAVVERKNRDGSVRKFNVKIHRSDFAYTKTNIGELSRPLAIPPSILLSSLEPDSFGWLHTDAEFVAWVDDPERFTQDPIPVFKATPLRVNGDRRMAAKEVRFLETIRLFIIRDFREGHENIDFYTRIVASRFPKDNWKKGEAIYVQKGLFLVEPDLTVMIDTKPTAVKVLTLFGDVLANEIPEPLP